MQRMPLGILDKYSKMKTSQVLSLEIWILEFYCAFQSYLYSISHYGMTPITNLANQHSIYIFSMLSRIFVNVYEYSDLRTANSFSSKM
jgi:hypothetical protein